MTPKVFVRTYAKLKAEVTSAAYKPGQRLQARTLADALSASTSPITNAMRQLVGEQVLEYTVEDGFIIPWVTERRLKDLLSWTAWLTTAAFEDLDSGQPAPLPRPSAAAGQDVVEVTEKLFLALAGGAPNGDHVWSIGNSNDRLRSTRHLEAKLFTDRAEEVAALAELATAGNRPALRRALARYHKRRLDVLSQLVGLSYQDRP